MLSIDFKNYNVFTDCIIMIIIFLVKILFITKTVLKYKFVTIRLKTKPL